VEAEVEGTVEVVESVMAWVQRGGPFFARVDSGEARARDLLGETGFAAR
jgi:hypothetical protein